MELLGLNKFKTPAPDGFHLTGRLKQTDADFRVTEVLPENLLDAPPPKKARTIGHEELPQEMKESICAILESVEVGKIRAACVKGIEPDLKFERSLGVFEDHHRRAVHDLVTTQAPFMVSVSNKGEILLKPNHRSFVELVNASNFDAASSIHQISPFSGVNDVVVKDAKFVDKVGRTAFAKAMRKYFVKLLEFKYEENGNFYRVLLRKKKDQTFKLVTIKRVGLEHNEMIAIMARLLRIKKSDISYAGTKDARAIVIQHLSVFSKHEDVSLDHPKLEVFIYNFWVPVQKFDLTHSTPRYCPSSLFTGIFNWASSSVTSSQSTLLSSRRTVPIRLGIEWHNLPSVVLSTTLDCSVLVAPPLTSKKHH